MNKYVAAAIAAAGVVCASNAAADTVVVTSPGGTFTNPLPVNTAGPGAGFDRWFANNVRSNGSAGITTSYADAGNGSLQFGVVAPPLGSGSSNSKADFEYYFSSSFLLSDLTSFSYDYLRASGGSAAARYMPALRLYVSNGVNSGYLVYENVYNGVSASPLDTFTNVDVFSKKVWGTGSLPDAFTNYNRTIADWVALVPNLRVTALSVGVGSGWDGSLTGAVDNITFGTAARGTTTFNFEVAAAVPEAATWAMMICGFGMVGGAMRRKATRAIA